MAKAVALTARNLVHQALNHLLETHLVPEVVCVAMHRSLPQGHPVREVLAPHLQHCIPINVAARKLLLSPDGLIDQSMASGAAGFVDLITASWSDWSWARGCFHAKLKRRGVDRKEALPNYPYRDDGAAYWDVLDRYVGQTLLASGLDAERVRGDAALAAFAASMQEEGGMQGLPDLGDLSALRAFVVECIFKVTGQHHSMQFNQYAEYGHPPGTAAALYQPVPVDGLLSEADFIAAMPPVAAATSQISAAHVLERPTAESMQDLATRRGLTSLYAALDTLGKGIDVANVQRLAPFTGFHPSHMPARVEI